MVEAGSFYTFYQNKLTGQRQDKELTGQGNLGFSHLIREESK